MNKTEIIHWKDSAALSLSHNREEIKENAFFSFEVTKQQKEYLEGHIEDIDNWCEQHLDTTPHTIMFEEFGDGYTCDCYLF